MTYEFMSDDRGDFALHEHARTWTSRSLPRNIQRFWRLYAFGEDILLGFGMYWFSNSVSRFFSNDNQLLVQFFVFLILVFALIFFRRRRAQLNRSVHEKQLMEKLNTPPFSTVLDEQGIENSSPYYSIRISWDAVEDTETTDKAIYLKAGSHVIFLPKSDVPNEKWDEVVAFVQSRGGRA